MKPVASQMGEWSLSPPSSYNLSDPGAEMMMAQGLSGGEAGKLYLNQHCLLIILYLNLDFMLESKRQTWEAPWNLFYSSSRCDHIK